MVAHWYCAVGCTLHVPQVVKHFVYIPPVVVR